MSPLQLPLPNETPRAAHDTVGVIVDRAGNVQAGTSFVISIYARWSRSSHRADGSSRSRSSV